MGPLRGKTVAITEARRAAELATLIAKLGGVPYSAPAVREVPRLDRAPALDVLDRICRGEVGVVVFLTGVGTRAFLSLAAEAGKREGLLQALAGMVVAARGPKPIAVLREAAVRIDLVPREPTSEGLLRAFAEADYEVRGKVVAVQLYGEENPFLVEGLRARGATVLEIPLYEWALPENQEPLIRLVHDLLCGGIDVLAFTSSPQIKHVFSVATHLGLGERLLAALRGPVTVAVVGPICRATVSGLGIVPRIQSDKNTMGALVHAISDYLADQEEHYARS
ncbi:MAG: uroporphyrinogen-III synthase [Candidatus Methylomirabilia bacterium]